MVLITSDADSLSMAIKKPEIEKTVKRKQDQNRKKKRLEDMQSLYQGGEM